MLKEITNYSFFSYKLMRKAFPRNWLEGSWNVQVVESDGLEISCRLIRNLAEITRASRVELIILVQYERELGEANLQLIDRLRYCLGRCRPELGGFERRAPADEERQPGTVPAVIYLPHTPSGNEWTARQIAARLTELSLLPSNPSG